MTFEQIQTFDFKIGDKFLYEYHTTYDDIIPCIGLIREVDGYDIRFIDLEAADTEHIGTDIMTFKDIFIGEDSRILTKLQLPPLLTLAQQAHPEYFI